MPHRLYNRKHPYLSAFFAPLFRFDDSGPMAKMFALAWVVVQALWHDLFIWLLGVLLLAHAADWHFGRKAAIAEDRFDPDWSSWGLQSKIASVVQVCVIRVLEYTMARFDVADTAGMFAVAVVAALIYQDLDSIERHRKALGGSPMPVLSHVLDGMRQFTEAVLPGGDRSSDQD